MVTALEPLSAISALSCGTVWSYYCCCWGMGGALAVVEALISTWKAVVCCSCFVSTTLSASTGLSLLDYCFYCWSVEFWSWRDCGCCRKILTDASMSMKAPWPAAELIAVAALPRLTVAWPQRTSISGSVGYYDVVISFCYWLVVRSGLADGAHSPPPASPSTRLFLWGCPPSSSELLTETSFWLSSFYYS